ncbi:MAG: hypothetical protein MUP16_05265 [Sedimentisphaerales bacterium]|nr:hypothetical protein [Sedimentisphaerales bacterium]
MKTFVKNTRFTPLEIPSIREKQAYGRLFLTGFTLVELLVASTIGAFLVLVAVGTLRTVSTSAKMVTTHIDSTAEVRFASSLIARDLANIFRDPNFAHIKFVGSTGDSQDSTACDLTFYTINRVKARADQPEADVYEVEYYLTRDEEQSILFRRLWPYPDPNSQTEKGGVLTIIAEDIEIFEVRYYDGSEWSNEWPEDMETVPQLVEVNIVAKSPEKASPVIETFIVNLKPLADMITAYASAAQQQSAQQSETQQSETQQSQTQQSQEQQGSAQQAAGQFSGLGGGQFGGGQRGGPQQGGAPQGGGQQGGGQQGGQQGGRPQGGEQGGGAPQGGPQQGGGQQGGGQQGGAQQGGGRG